MVVAQTAYIITQATKRKEPLHNKQQRLDPAESTSQVLKSTTTPPPHRNDDNMSFKIFEALEFVWNFIWQILRLESWDSTSGVWK